MSQFTAAWHSKVYFILIINNTKTTKQTCRNIQKLNCLKSNGKLGESFLSQLLNRQHLPFTKQCHDINYVRRKVSNLKFLSKVHKASSRHLKTSCLFLNSWTVHWTECTHAVSSLLKCLKLATNKMTSQLENWLVEHCATISVHSMPQEIKQITANVKKSLLSCHVFLWAGGISCWLRHQRNVMSREKCAHRSSPVSFIRSQLWLLRRNAQLSEVQHQHTTVSVTYNNHRHC